MQGKLELAGPMSKEMNEHSVQRSNGEGETPRGGAQEGEKGGTR